MHGETVKFTLKPYPHVPRHMIPAKQKPDTRPNISTFVPLKFLDI